LQDFLGEEAFGGFVVPAGLEFELQNVYSADKKQDANKSWW
jgi:hypothetical protein